MFATYAPLTVKALATCKTTMNDSAESDIAPPQCWLRRCKHFQGIKELDPVVGEASERPYCPAFPNGIPLRIAYGRDRHLVPAKDQVSTVVFEPAVS
jgi:hypothetical protein